MNRILKMVGLKGDALKVGDVYPVEMYHPGSEKPFATANGKVTELLLMGFDSFIADVGGLPHRFYMEQGWTSAKAELEVA